MRCIVAAATPSDLTIDPAVSNSSSILSLGLNRLLCVVFFGMIVRHYSSDGEHSIPRDPLTVCKLCL